jgi:hypothetical protein
VFFLVGARVCVIVGFLHVSHDVFVLRKFRPRLHDQSCLSKRLHQLNSIMCVCVCVSV